MIAAASTTVGPNRDAWIVIVLVVVVVIVLAFRKGRKS